MNTQPSPSNSIKPSCAVCGGDIQLVSNGRAMAPYWLHSDGTNKDHAAAPVHPPGDARQIPDSAHSHCAICGQIIHHVTNPDGSGHGWLHSSGNPYSHVAVPKVNLVSSEENTAARKAAESGRITTSEGQNNICAVCGHGIEYVPGPDQRPTYWKHTGTLPEGVTHHAVPSGYSPSPAPHFDQNKVTIVEMVNELRYETKHMGITVKELLKHSFFTDPRPMDDKVDTGEMRANIMLAYRHLEDAAMRLGKVLQAKDGGVSCYDPQKAMVDQQLTNDAHALCLAIEELEGGDHQTKVSLMASALLTNIRGVK